MHGFIAAGTFSFGQLYLVEISSSKVRGALGATLLLAANFGIVIAFAIGTYCGYHATPLFAIIVNALFVAMFFVFPETPIFLVKQNQIQVHFPFKK